MEYKSEHPAVMQGNEVHLRYHWKRVLGTLAVHCNRIAFCSQLACLKSGMLHMLHMICIKHGRHAMTNCSEF